MIWDLNITLNWMVAHFPLRPGSGFCPLIHPLSSSVCLNSFSMGKDPRKPLAWGSEEASWGDEASSAWVQHSCLIRSCSFSMHRCSRTPETKGQQPFWMSVSLAEAQLLTMLCSGPAEPTLLNSRTRLNERDQRRVHGMSKQTSWAPFLRQKQRQDVVLEETNPH